ncbi:thiopeptide-type bacteriocin biosynthesis protein [Pseudonocardia sp. CA-107938]|uniref:lantibiotic dehydratase n=1 Tax=Pseudonocardia sp. CA-107938 TaxID=3240021 RepID=UPI003D8E6F23
MSAQFALVRTALLSVGEAAAMVTAGECDDPVALAAVELAAGPRVAAGDSERARAARARYLARMGGRATPFGIFAGTAVADIGDARQLDLDVRVRHRAHVRVDAEALRLLVQESYDEQPFGNRPFRANPTLRVDGSVLRFTRLGDATADVVAMRAKPAIRTVLAILDQGPATGAELVDGLAAHGGPAALAAFVEQLVGTGLLVPALDLLEPGKEPAELALALLERMGDTTRAAALRTLLAAGCGPRPLDAALPQRLSAAWRAAAPATAAWSDIGAPHRFHLDLQLGVPAAVLDRATVDDLEAALLRVRAMSSGRHELDDVRDAFVARYEDAEVPLLEALDLEVGVVQHHARAASVLAGSAGVRFADSDDPPRVDPRRLAVLDTWLRAGCPAEGVDIADLPAAEHTPVRSVQAVLLDDHEGRYRALLVGGGGRAPFALMARFAPGRDDLERRMARWVADDGPDPDEPIRAELVHNPGGRIANVLVRPRVYEHTIALAGAGGGSLSLDRLLLRVQGDRFALRDARTGRPVHVELSSAHNVDMAGQDPLYSFLGHLAAPGGAAWSWGALERLSRLPRITCGSVVVAPQRWRVEAAEVAEVLASPSPAARLRQLLPGVADRRWVGTGVYDHVLPIDLSTNASVAAALGRSGTRAIDVFEMPQLESPAVRGPNGRHVAEVVVPVRARRPAAVGPVPARFEQRHGDGWVYFRFHTGFAAADTVVTRAADLARRLRATGTATGWFYLRYGEGGHHVRVRIRPAEGAADAVVAALRALGRELRAEALVSRVVMDDYVPEVARYGGAAGLALAEELFVADSDDVARVIAAGTAEADRLYRTVADMVAWCDALFADPASAQEFLRLGGTGQGLQFLAEGNRHGMFHREHRTVLEEHLARVAPDDAVLDRLRALATQVRGRLDRRRSDSVLGSALHMHCNRMFAFDANRLEFLAYELARRTLRAREARRRAS